MPNLQPLIATLVRDAIPRSDRASIAAAAAIGRDRAFRSAAEVAAITTHVLIIPGDDDRHPTELAHRISVLMPRALFAPVSMSRTLGTADDLASAFAPAIRAYLKDLPPATTG